MFVSYGAARIRRLKANSDHFFAMPQARLQWPTKSGLL